MLDTDIDALSLAETLQAVDGCIRRNEPLHLLGVNADKLNQLGGDERLRKIAAGCGIVHADGGSVVLASRFLKTPLPERVAGIDLMQELLRMCALKRYEVYFLGAERAVVEETVHRTCARFEGLSVCGFRDGYFSDGEWTDVSREIAAVRPKIVFVGISSPKKEYLIEFFQREGHREVFMGVGGCFDVLSGRYRRAPKWMRRVNLEWLFRMCQEPRRLWKRYLFGNAKFVGRILAEKVGRMKAA